MKSGLKSWRSSQGGSQKVELPEHAGDAYAVRLARSAPVVAGIIALGVLIILGFVLVPAFPAQADSHQTLDVTVDDSTGGAEPDAIDIAGLSYEDAVDALDDAIDDSATLPISPDGFPAVSSSDAHFFLGDEASGQYSVAVRGDVTLLGLPATMLVTATWEDEATDTSPETAIFFSFASVSLSDLTAYTGPPIELSHSWIGVAATEHTVEIDALPGDVASLLDDGLATTEDDFAVGPDSLAFRGVLSSSDPVIREAASQLGLSGDIRIDGVLSGDISGLGGSEPPTASAGLELSVSLPTASSSSLPEWFTPTGSWLLELSVETEGTISASISGSAGVTAGETTYSVSASVGVAWDGTDATFSVDAELDPVDNLFNLDWLDLETFSVEASFTTAGAFSGGLKATVDLNDLTGQDATGSLAFEFAADSDGSSGSFELTSDLTISVSDIATALGATAPADFDVTINGFALFVGFESGTSGTEVTVAMSTNVVVDINNAVIDSDLLFRLTTRGGNPTQFLFAVKPGEGAAAVTVGQLLGFDFDDADITLPRFTLSVSNADWDVSADDLDGPTAAYLGDDEDLDIAQGVVITSEVVIPQQLTDALAEVGITTEGDLKLVGKLPVLGSTELSIAVNLPTIVGAPNEPFRQGNLALVFKSPSAGTYQISIEGDVTIGVPRTEDADCSAPYAGAVRTNWSSTSLRHSPSVARTGSPSRSKVGLRQATTLAGSSRSACRA